jgi:hypothetical protein
VIAAQVTQLAGDLPRYEVTMRDKIKSLRGTSATSGTLERAAYACVWRPPESLRVRC